MAFQTDYISYGDTKSFAPLVLDYLAEEKTLRSFYDYPPTFAGIELAIENRKKFPVDRQLLHQQFLKLYGDVDAGEKVKQNIEAIISENCFTICTAHQPNLFTGHLYFIYKILHSIKLAETLAEKLTSYKFVPVYFMGSEDADIEELGEVDINGTHHQWKPAQTGAVGRMMVDDDLQKLITDLQAELGVLPNASSIFAKLSACYTKGKLIEAATFEFVHWLFAAYGLLIFMPDDRAFKKAFLPLAKKELDTSFSASAVQETIKALPPKYKLQTEGREINLFYLQGDKRERIEKAGDEYIVEERKISREDLLAEIGADPRIVSPNVILRPVFQEMLLPNIAFIGGGGELAYWLELKKVFEAANVFFPVLVLRNSFTIINAQMVELQQKLELTDADLFSSTLALENKLVKRKENEQLSLSKEIDDLNDTYQNVALAAGKYSESLATHAKALEHTAGKKLLALEKKMLRAARKNNEAEARQVAKLKNILFPKGNLQERVDNILPWFAKYGPEMINDIYDASLSLEGNFCILKEKP